jgi:ElaB/YqjD/DUF883 family membrane-anchored ribosome-binding protein
MDDATGRVKGSEGRKRGTSAAVDVEPVDPSLPQETDERARELRVEIAETRGEMSETIEAIQERLTPSNIVANAKESVRNVTTEKVKQMANTAENAADRVMHNSFMDTVRENPIPAAMIGLGAAWLLMKGRSDSQNDYYYDDAGYRTAYDRMGTRGRYDWRTRTGGAGVPRYSSMDTEHYTADDSGGGVADTASNAASSARDMASNAASRASEYMDDAGYAVRRTTRRAQSSFDRVLRENPLALGAAATLIGAAIGMTIPATEAENEWMGEARDNVVERARGMASEAAERVQNAAEQVKDVAGKAVQSTRPEGATSRGNIGAPRQNTEGTRPDTAANKPGGSI